MSTSKNPAKARPLSANVLRLMRLSRTAPKNDDVVKFGREFSLSDLAYCNKQGMLFMEASSMGIPMEEFAPMFMTSQMACIFDVSFSTSNDMGSPELANFLKIPMLMKSPEAVVEALYWIDEIIENADDAENKSLLISKAYDAERLRLPVALAMLPDEPNRNVDDLSYAYWLGYIYRCECLLHEESSRMVYGAFDETVMRAVYEKLMESPMANMDLDANAILICEELDRLLVEKLWPGKSRMQEELQKKELSRGTEVKKGKKKKAAEA